MDGHIRVLILVLMALVQFRSQNQLWPTTNLIDLRKFAEFDFLFDFLLLLPLFDSLLLVPSCPHLLLLPFANSRARDMIF